MQSDAPTIYLETTVLLDFVEKPKSDPHSQAIAKVIEAAEAQQCRVVTSVLSIAEVFYAKHEADTKIIDPEIQKVIDYLWHPDSSPIEPIPVHELIAREAHILLRSRVKDGWAKTKGGDAIHLVTAKREKVSEFFTTERKMERWGAGLGFNVCLPHTKFLITEEPPSPLYDGVKKEDVWPPHKITKPSK